MKLPRHRMTRAWQWREKLLNKETTPKEITQEYLKRIEEDQTNSFVSVQAEAALKQAETVKVDKESAPLAGMPLGLKDLIVTEGVPTTCASKILEGYVPPYNSTVASKINSAQGICLGKINMDEFAMGSSNEHSAFGAVKNPLDLTRVPGGSSGGSAAAVAANLVPFSLGSDTGGSVRQPASFCGVVGLKPTYGRVSRYGLIAFASSLDQIGVLSLDSLDCANMFGTIAGYDENDSTSSSTKVEDFATSVREIYEKKSAQKNALQGLKIGVIEDFRSDGLEPEVAASLQDIIENLRKAGATVETVGLKHASYALAVYYIVAVSEASANLARFDGVRYGKRVLPRGENTSLEEMYEATRGELFGPEVKRRILLGTFALSSGYYDAYYKKACQVRNLICQDYQKAFGSFDLLLSPTAPTVAFPIGDKSRKDPLQMYLNDICTVPVNLAGLPAISFPWLTGKDDLPIGMQLTAPAFAEKRLLDVTAALEKVYDEAHG